MNLFGHVTAFNRSDYCIDQSNCKTAVTCQNKFTTPPHQYGRLLNCTIVNCSSDKEFEFFLVQLSSRNYLGSFANVCTGGGTNFCLPSQT